MNKTSDYALFSNITILIIANQCLELRTNTEEKITTTTRFFFYSYDNKTLRNYSWNRTLMTLILFLFFCFHS